MANQQKKFIKYYWSYSMSFSSRAYWEDRYSKGGTSGWGSYGDAAEYKTKVINDFLERFKPNSTIEFGCGDGNQIKNINYKNYLGFDFAPAIKICKEVFKGDEKFNFSVIDDYSDQKSDLTVSLDVVYHLVEYGVYENHMKSLFDASKKYVIIFTTDRDDEIGTTVKHCFSRNISNYVKENFKNFAPLHFESENFCEKNPFSDANFLFFQRIENV